MLRQAGTAESVAGAEEGGHSTAAGCLGVQREMPEALDAPQRERYAHEYVDLRPRLEALFRKRFPTLRGQEGDFYNDAWESLLQSETQPDALFAYLDRALYTRGLNELRRRDRRPADQAQAGEPVELDGLAERTDREPGETVVDDIAAAATQKLLLDRLSPRQARIIKLHYGWSLTVGEVAAALSVSKRTVRREVEDAAPKITENAEWLTPCAEGGRRSLVRAYVLGFLSSGRAAKAAAHLETCAGCRALREQMEEALRGVAAAVPAAVVAEPPTAPLLPERMLQGADAAREQLADLAVGVKQQAVGLVARAPGGDAAAQASAAGGPRGSGAMIAAAASSLVIGGGGVTYSVIEGVPGPIRAAIGADERPDVGRAKSDEPAEEPVAAPVDPAPPTVPPAAPNPDAGATPPMPAETEPPPVPAAEEEFGIEQSAPPVAGASSAEPAPEPSPPPAPSDGSEEFGFER